MNNTLLNNRPKDSNKEEFIKAWNNSSYVLEAFYKTLVSIQKDLDSVKKDDFDCPNHYAKLSFQMGQSKMIDTILAMLPESAKP